ncbi:MAG: hypothetical protein ACI30I_01085 [Parabacteroides sp.]
MKKCVFYLVSILCLCVCLSSCSDDEKEQGGWESLSGLYDNTRTLSVLLGDVTLPLGNKTVEVAASSATQASVTLNNVVPEAATLTLTATLQEADGVVSLTGEATAGECIVRVNGTFENGKLTLVVNRQITSPVAGEWKVRMTPNGASAMAAVYAVLVTGNAQLDALSAMAGPLVGGLIASKVEYVKSSLTENGVMGVAWKSRASDQPVDLSAFTEALSLQYCTKEGRLLIAIDKAYTDLLTLAESKLAEFGLSAEMITSMMVDLGGYYALPLSYQMEGDRTCTFYLTKDLLVPTMQVALPLLMSMIPEAYQGLVSSLLPALQNAQTLDFGLVFDK